jgi:hypothetical protein
MNAIDWFWHLANFIAPALWLGLTLAVWDWAVNFWKTHAWTRHRHWSRNLLLDWASGIAVLLAGLLITGHDGRMWTYGALVLAVTARRLTGI